jgi:hypothetical protein
VRRDGGDVTKVESYLRRPRRIRPGELIFLHLPNALVQLRGSRIEIPHAWPRWS